MCQRKLAKKEVITIKIADGFSKERLEKSVTEQYKTNYEYHKKKTKGDVFRIAKSSTMCMAMIVRFVLACCIYVIGFALFRIHDYLYVALSIVAVLYFAVTIKQLFDVSASIENPFLKDETEEK